MPSHLGPVHVLLQSLYLTGGEQTLAVAQRPRDILPCVPAASPSRTILYSTGTVPYRYNIGTVRYCTLPYRTIHYNMVFVQQLGFATASPA